MVRSTHSCFSYGDVSEEFTETAISHGSIACDIETSGLDWRKDRIGTIQIFVTDRNFTILRPGDSTPTRLLKLLSREDVRKIFHHAMFDLRFLCSSWQLTPANICCTKIAAKLLSRTKSEHSLVFLLEKHLGIKIDKRLQKSDWLDDHLTDDQVSYAINDVRYLQELFAKLNRRLLEVGRADLACKCFSFIPTQVKLEIEGYSEIFEY
jgi:ribonuclease D